MALAIPPLVCRPNLIPTWDLRKAVLIAVAISLEPITAEALAAQLSAPFGRANEDDYFAVRAALSWTTIKKWCQPIRFAKGAHPVYTITERGLATLDGPDHVFL
jgi:hypothetical protein